LDFIGKAPGADVNKLFAILAATVKERLLCACAYRSPCLTPSNLKKYQGKLLLIFSSYKQDRSHKNYS
jgi:hypothetical protein